MPEMATQVHLEMKKTQKKMFLSFNVQSLSNKYEKQKTQLIFLITLQNQDFLSHVSQFIQREDIEPSLRFLEKCFDLHQFNEGYKRGILHF